MAETAEKLESYSIRLPAEVIEWIEKEGKAQERAPRWIARKILQGHVDRAVKKKTRGRGRPKK